MTHTLAVRLDSLGDALVTSPGFRALALRDGPVHVLCGPAALPAMPFLPGVGRATAWQCPWIDPSAPRVTAASIQALREIATGVEEAVIFTSFHQSALPTALVLRLAGVKRIGAYSVDYPGSLLDVRATDPGEVPEPERAVALARACGFPDDGPRMKVKPEACAAELPLWVDPDALVVVHPGASAETRRWPREQMRMLVSALAEAGYQPIVTGAGAERELTAFTAGRDGVDAGGRLDFAQLATLLSRARVLVAGNTGPAHLAAAVGTPVVSLFSPVVSARRWAPYGVPVELLGDRDAACAGSRARDCQIPGHPCLASVRVADVMAAVARLHEGSQPDAGSGHHTGPTRAAELEEAR